MPVDPADFYDRLGDREFARPSVVNFVSEVLHRSTLNRVSGQVADVGAGVGRFSAGLARRASSLVIVDVSGSQLERNRAALEQRGLLGKVERFVQADVSSLSELSSDSFDSVVCFRGPLNYCVLTFEVAIDELLRVLRPGGTLFLSVRTLQSGVRPLVQAGFQLQDGAAFEEALRLFDSLVLEHPTSPSMRLFSVGEILSLLDARGASIDRLSGDGVIAPWLDRSTPRHLWRKLVRIEKRLAGDPYGIAHANHAILVARKADQVGPGRESHHRG
jgi:ubiquinone/menaquinone biosynthesis C-methylase UbiE